MSVFRIEAEEKVAGELVLIAGHGERVAARDLASVG